MNILFWLLSWVGSLLAFFMCLLFMRSASDLPKLKLGTAVGLLFSLLRYNSVQSFPSFPLKLAIVAG